MVPQYAQMDLFEKRACELIRCQGISDNKIMFFSNCSTVYVKCFWKKLSGFSPKSEKDSLTLLFGFSIYIDPCVDKHPPGDLSRPSRRVPTPLSLPFFFFVQLNLSKDIIWSAGLVARLEGNNQFPLHLEKARINRMWPISPIHQWKTFLLRILITIAIFTCTRV